MQGIWNHILMQWWDIWIVTWTLFTTNHYEARNSPQLLWSIISCMNYKIFVVWATTRQWLDLGMGNGDVFYHHHQGCNHLIIIIIIRICIIILIIIMFTSEWLMFVGGNGSPGEVPRATCPHTPSKHLFCFGKHSKMGRKFIKKYRAKISVGSWFLILA